MKALRDCRNLHEALDSFLSTVNRVEEMPPELVRDIRTIFCFGYAAGVGLTLRRALTHSAMLQHVELLKKIFDRGYEEAAEYVEIPGYWGDEETSEE